MSTPPDNFCRIFLVLRLSTFVHGTEWTQETTSSLMSVVVWPSQQVSLYSCLQHFQCESLLTFSVTYFLIPLTIRTQEQVLSPSRDSILIFNTRNVLDDNRPSHPELDLSSCFHGSILSLEMIDHFEARYTLDMILSVCHVDRHQVS